MKNIISILILTWVFAACNSDGLETLNLQSQGANISIKAPADAEVKSAPIGFRKEITVKQDTYDLLISVAQDVTQTADELHKSNLESVKGSEVFSRIVQEDSDGFIYEINQGADKNYDFRYIYVKNGAAYHFRRNFVGDFTLDEVKKMYNSVKQ